VTPDSDLTVRRLTAADVLASQELSHLAFGVGRPDPDRPPTPSPATRWGVFAPDGRLLAKATDRAQKHWFGGAPVPASGVAGVAVAPEARGRGLAQLVLNRLLVEARANGAVIATLFRTAPALYRRLGFEHVGTLNWYTTPTLALSGFRAPNGTTLRSATAADVPHVFELYRTVARTRNGLLERSGPLFATDPEQVLRAFDGITLAVGPTGAVEGYCSWDRGTGWNGPARLTVWDLVAVTGTATRALLAGLGSWSSVLPTLALRLPDPDPTRWLLPVGDLTVENQQAWMLKILDADAAVRARSWPEHLRASVPLTLLDGTGPATAAPTPDGRCCWVFEDGAARLEPDGGTHRDDSTDVRLDIRGLSVLYAGAGSAAMLRQAGLLDGGDARTDAVLDAASAGPPPALLDFF
jgi:predicted acetyltransferase